MVENGTFDAFWDTISFGFNGLVFFFAGASATNFAWRSTEVNWLLDAVQQAGVIVYSALQRQFKPPRETSPASSEPCTCASLYSENFVSQELYEDDGNIAALFTTFWRLPLLYLTLMVVRFICIALFNPLFQLTNAGVPLWFLLLLLAWPHPCSG